MPHTKISMKNNSDKFFYCLKKATQILLSVSVFSFLFSRKSSLSPFLAMSYDYVVSNCSVKLFTYTSERNYIFLLCNGILVLIIQSSGLITTHNPKVVTGVVNDIVHDHVEEAIDHGSVIKSANVNVVREVEYFEEKEVASDHVEVKEEMGNFSPEEVEAEEDEEDDDDEEEGLTTDELNKKCEDFIKKMKLELHGVIRFKD